MMGAETAAAPEAPVKKINLLIVASALWIGGAEMVIRHLAYNIDRRRFNVTVCHIKGRGQIGDEIAQSGIELIDLSDPPGGKVNYLSFRKLLKVVRSHHIDLIHTHTTQGLVDSALCRLFVPRLKIVHTFHFGNYPTTRPRIILMERIFGRLATRLVAVGEVQRRQVQSLFHFSEKRMRTIWNGVGESVGAGDTAFRSRVGAEGKLVVGTIATLVEQKGLPDLIRVARRVRDAHPNVCFVIVGDGVMRGELEAMRQELGLEDTVLLAGWVRNAAEVALPTFDIFFQPSRWEAMSVVLLEAMAAGKPLVTTRVGEAPHIIEDGVDGILADVGDVDGMAVALGTLIADAELRRRMGQAARHKWEERFTIAPMTRAYERVYGEALG